jgi:hypothetical protein
MKESDGEAEDRIVREAPMTYGTRATWEFKHMLVITME